jgi:hypothetical protein
MKIPALISFCLAPIAPTDPLASIASKAPKFSVLQQMLRQQISRLKFKSSCIFNDSVSNSFNCREKNERVALSIQFLCAIELVPLSAVTKSAT